MALYRQKLIVLPRSPTELVKVMANNLKARVRWLSCQRGLVPDPATKARRCGRSWIGGVQSGAPSDWQVRRPRRTRSAPATWSQFGQLPRERAPRAEGEWPTPWIALILGI